MALEIGRPEERVAMRVSWFVERIAKGASSPHWCTERMNMWEVLQDPAAAKDAGDHFRFIAPSSATDEDLDALLRRGAMPTGGGRIYQQTFIDTYAKVAFAKLYDRKTPITAATLVNDRIGPFYDAHQVKLCRVLTDRGTEDCGNPEHHEYELYLAVEDIDRSRTKAKRPQTNGIVERFHKTVLDEFYRVAFRKKVYGSIGGLQHDLDGWIRSSNEERSHQGRWCFGKTPMQTFLDAIPIARKKMIAA
jgi:hypothetical protein